MIWKYCDDLKILKSFKNIGMIEKDCNNEKRLQ